MKNLCKKALAVLFATVLVFSYSMMTMAEEVPSTEVNAEGVGYSIMSNHYENAVPVNSTSWTEVAYSTTGFNCNVKFFPVFGGLGSMSIRAVGKNGNTLWTEKGALTLTSGNRVMHFDSNVYSIQAQMTSGVGTVTTAETTEPAN